MLPHRFTTALFAVIAAVAVTMATHRAAADDLGPDGALCAYETTSQARDNGFPENLLTALSYVESGRWDSLRKAKVAWPWTVMAEGRGRFFRTKAEAVREVRDLQASGVRNIDVGCMQINLMYHADAFPDLESAFDPATNVRYAVDFLRALRAETGSWMKAATRYHSATPEHARRYHGKLSAEWNSLNTEGSPEAVHMARLATEFPNGEMSSARPSPAPDTANAERQQALALAKAALDKQRDEARRFAENWRAQRLAEYKKAKQDRAARDAS